MCRNLRSVRLNWLRFDAFHGNERFWSLFAKKPLAMSFSFVNSLINQSTNVIC